MSRTESSTPAGEPRPPELDHELSPYTGFGRAHWEALADRMLLAVRPYATPRHGLIDLPGPASGSGRWSDGLEGFARTFLLAGFRLAQGGEQDRHNFAEWYASGLAVGVDPSSPERWPTFTEKFQAVVECASIALALHESRPYLWDRLDRSVQRHVIDWMGQIVGLHTWDNNWVWFQSVTEAFLRTVGGPWSAQDLEVNIAKTDSWYTGDGWYSDGDQEGSHRNYDYYSGWAMQFYPLWYCRVSGADAEAGLFDRYVDRLRRYLQDAQHFVASNGSPVAQGRSLSYRYAMLAPFWAGELAGTGALAPGRTRRLASGVLRHFLSAGCLDNRGLQPIGWHGAFEPIRQRYSGPGSPYWSSKGFAGLVLPPNHPVWTDTEEPLAIEQSDIEVTIAPAGFVLSGTRADGIVRITNHRSDHAVPNEAPVDGDDPVYARHAYATHAAPDYGDIDVSTPLDSHVALLTADGRASRRRPFELLRIEGRAAVSRHRARWPMMFDQRLGPWLTTASVSRGALEIRLARVEPADDGLSVPGPWWLRFGGYPIAGALPDFVDITDPVADGNIDGNPGAAAAVRKGGLTSTVRLLGNSAATGEARASAVAGVKTVDGANPMGERSLTPWARGTEPIEHHKVYAALVVLTGVPLDTGVSFSVDGDLVTVRWPDGLTDTVSLST